MLDPVIKWIGSKRFQAKEIVEWIGIPYDTYSELFCGGCSVLFYILNYCPEKFKNFICNDINGDLISTYKLIQDDWKSIYDYYHDFWNELNKDDDFGRKKEYFNLVRAEMNKTHDPRMFFSIMRTCANGMPRYNSGGCFNTSFHITRKGIEPKKIKSILENWSGLLNKHNVQFLNFPYNHFTNIKNTDFVYLDPPYANTKGMYFGQIDYSGLWKYIGELQCDYALSFDGVAGNDDFTQNVPEHLYNKHIFLKNGNSSFRRIIGTSNDTTVKESLYLNLRRINS